MSVFTSSLVPYGSGQKALIGGLEDSALRSDLRRYKRNVAKRYRIIFPEKITEFLPEGTLHISAKVDGELWFLVKRAGEVALVAINGRVIVGIPVVEEAAQHLADVETALIAGELFFARGRDEGRPRVHDVAKAFRDPALSGRLGFKVFDIVALDGVDHQLETYDTRWAEITRLFGAGKRCSPVLNIEGTREDARDRYAEWVDSLKFEGLVVRSEQGQTYKIKPAITIDAVILAFGERQVGAVTQVREFQVGLKRDDGSFHVLGSVGTGIKDEERTAWHQRLSAMVVDSSYRLANREGTLCRFVRPEIIVEIRCSDLLDSDSNDAPTRRMTLRYDTTEGYTPLEALPMPSLIHPVFLAERTDKLPDQAHIGLEQIYRYVPFEDREVEAQVITLPRSQVILRRVYTKTTKGKVAVRKVVGIATHKAEADPRFPPFVLHMTDFSAGRKEPLQTSLRVASSEAYLDTLVEAWIEKNIKRGWSEVGVEIVA